MDESLRFSSFLEVQKGPGRSRPTAAEAPGRTLWELFGANPAFDVFWRALRAALPARRPVSDLRLVYTRPEGGRFRWRIHGQPYSHRTGRFRGYRGVAQTE